MGESIARERDDYEAKGIIHPQMKGDYSAADERGYSQIRMRKSYLKYLLILICVYLRPSAAQNVPAIIPESLIERYQRDP